MDIPLEDLAPLFEAYGAACFEAQHLEHGLLLLLKLLRHPNLGSKPTLGKLIQHTKELELFSGDDLSILKHALERRNRLVHGFWHQGQVLEMRKAQVRANILRELESHRFDLRRAGALIDKIIDSFISHAGLSLADFGDAAVTDWQSDIAYAEELLENL